MSIVGTRPPLISETNLYELHHRVRLAIKPGITGMWQVSGRSDITDFEEVVRLDKELRMRIGIITFHASLNCGSMLQAFALQEILEKKYHVDVEVINYSNWGQRNYYANWDLYSMQPALIKPFERPENREKFWQDFENDTFDSIAKEYGGYTFSNKIKYKLKKEKQRLMKR